MQSAINQLLEWRPNPELAAMPMVSADEQRRSMRNFAAGVSIITARNEEGRAGLTATAVCSVTVDPPRLVVFINKKVVASRLALEGGALCVNLLAGDQEEVGRAFAGMMEGVHGDDRFRYGQWTQIVTGAPALENALANFDTRVVKIYDESTHHAFLCEVLCIRERNDANALLYFNGQFHETPK